MSDVIKGTETEENIKLIKSLNEEQLLRLLVLLMLDYHNGYFKREYQIELIKEVRGG